MGKGQEPKVPLLGDFRSIVDPLAKTLGPLGEVVLHRFDDLGHSIIEISGNITGRSRGGPVTNLVLSMIRTQEFQDLVNYENKLEDGRVLRSSTIFVREAGGKAVGCLCINMDLSGLEHARYVLESLCLRNRADSHSTTSERFSTDVCDMARAMLSAAVERVGKPAAYMQKDDKLGVVRNLDSQGFFLIKGGVELVAEALNVSRYTVYNYLDETRGILNEQRKGEGT